MIQFITRLSWLADLHYHFLPYYKLISNADVLLIKQRTRNVLAESADFEEMCFGGILSLPFCIVTGTILMQCFVDATVEGMLLLITYETEMCDFNFALTR